MSKMENRAHNRKEVVHFACCAFVQSMWSFFIRGTTQRKDMAADGKRHMFGAASGGDKSGLTMTLKRRRTSGDEGDDDVPTKYTGKVGAVEYEHRAYQLGATYGLDGFDWGFGSIPKDDDDFVQYTTAQLETWLERLERASMYMSMLSQADVDDSRSLGSGSIVEMMHIYHRCHVANLACRRVLGARRSILVPEVADPSKLPNMCVAVTPHGRALMFAIMTGVSAGEAWQTVVDEMAADELQTRADAAAARGGHVVDDSPSPPPSGAVVTTTAEEEGKGQ